MPPGYGFSEEEDAVAALQFSTHNNECRSGQYPQDIIFRTVVNERLLVPLVEAFARACLQVQTLKKAYLMTTLREPVEFRGTMYDYPVDWGIYYSARANIILTTVDRISRTRRIAHGDGL